VTRDEAIALLRGGLARLPTGQARADAFEALDRLVFAVQADTSEGTVREAFHTLVMAVPELKPAAEKLLGDWTASREGSQ
jgi:hypothetical protein